MSRRWNSSEPSTRPDPRPVATTSLGLALAVLAIGALLELRGHMLAALGALETVNALQASRTRTIAYLLDESDDAVEDVREEHERRRRIDEALSAMESKVRGERELEPLVVDYVEAARGALATSNGAPLGAKTTAAGKLVARARRASEELDGALEERAFGRRAALRRDISWMVLAGAALIAGVGLAYLSRGWKWLAMGRRRLTMRGKDLEAIELLNRRLTLAMRSANVVAFGVEPSGKVIWSNEARSDILRGAAMPFLLSDLAPEPERARIQKRVVDACRSGETVEFEMKVERADFNPRWVKITLMPLGIEGASEMLGSAVDVTAIKRREDGNVLLMRELSHRSKNLLAIVQAMARQTSMTAASSVEFHERFAARLRALAAAHDLLVKTVYTSAEFGELIRTQIGVLATLIGSRVFTEGALVNLRPEATQALGMALHELATNARIHGAMTNSLGRLDITWRLEGGGPDGRLIVDWVESNGPNVAPADRRGFGSTLIVENLPRSLHGVVTLDHFPEGTRCHMDLPFKYTLESFAPDEGVAERAEASSA